MSELSCRCKTCSVDVASVHTRERPNLEEDDEGTDEHTDALQKISHHVDKCCSHTGIGLPSPLS